MMERIFLSLIFPQLITHNNVISCEKNTDNEKGKKKQWLLSIKRKYLIRDYYVVNATMIICTLIFGHLFFILIICMTITKVKFISLLKMSPITSKTFHFFPFL